MQSSRIISIANSPNTVSFIFINKSNPSLSFVLKVDEMETDELTISDIEKRLIGRFPEGNLEVTESYYSKEIDSTKDLGYLHAISPFYFELKQKMRVEVDPKLKISEFWLDIAPRMNGKNFFDQICKLTKLVRTSFYLTLVKDDKFTRISRNSIYQFEPKLLIGAKLLINKLSEEGSVMTITCKLEKDKKLIDLKVSPENTLRELTEIIDIETGIPSSTIKIIYDLEVLNEDNKSLKSFRMKEGSQVQIVKGPEGGNEQEPSVILESYTSKFVDISDSKGPEKRPWSKTAPKWRIVNPGLSVEGKCKNPACEANGKWVIINKGIGIVYDVSRDKTTNKCPLCDQFVNVELCAFNNCLYTYVGRKHMREGEPSVLVKSQEKLEAGDEYNRYDPAKSGTAEWDSLKICTEGLPKKEKSKKICPICKDWISDKPAILKCNHEFHPKCIPYSRDLQTAETSECILCSEPSTITSLYSIS